MRIRPVVRATIALALSLTAASVVAQQGSAELRGRVIDEQGAALPGAAIVIKHQESGIYRQANSNDRRELLHGAASCPARTSSPPS